MMRKLGDGKEVNCNARRFSGKANFKITESARMARSKIKPLPIKDIKGGRDRTCLPLTANQR